MSKNTYITLPVPVRFDFEDERVSAKSMLEKKLRIKQLDDLIVKHNTGIKNMKIIGYIFDENDKTLLIQIEVNHTEKEVKEILKANLVV